MDKETKLSPEEINCLKKELSEEGGEAKLEKLMNKHLDESQRQAVNSLLSDPERLRALINSPAAQRLLNMLKE